MTLSDHTSALQNIKSVAQSLKSKPISSAYFQAEKAIVDNIIARSHKEISSIAMSSFKFHKAYSI